LSALLSLLSLLSLLRARWLLGRLRWVSIPLRVDLRHPEHQQQRDESVKAMRAHRKLLGECHC
jgi:hypothetical protein